MTTGITGIAGELLRLEEQYQRGGSIDEQGERWRKLVIELIGQLRGEGDGRRWLRLPAGGVQVTLRRGVDEFVCTVCDLSHPGLMVRGDFPELSEGEELRLHGLTLDDQFHLIGLQYRVVWVKGETESATRSAGLELHDNNPQGRRRLFDCAYYPLYLQYLRELAQR